METLNEHNKSIVSNCLQVLDITIGKTGKSEIKQTPLLGNQKYTVLKNQEKRIKLKQSKKKRI